MGACSGFIDAVAGVLEADGERFIAGGGEAGVDVTEATDTGFAGSTTGAALGDDTGCCCCSA